MSWHYHIKEVRLGDRQWMEFSLNLTATAVEEKLREMTYAPLPHDPKLDLVRIPSIAVAFFTWVALADNIPSEQELVGMYWSMVAGKLKLVVPGVRTSQATKEVVAFRTNKAYPSLIRDLHFYLMCKEYGLDVEYSLRKDIESGIDLVIKKGGESFNIALFVDTPRASDFRAGKEGGDREDFDYIPIMLNLDACKRVGDFKLYENWRVEDMWKAIELAARIEKV